jgi:hypothetical protein
LLPVAGEVFPQGVRYMNPAVWGDATHASLYMAVVRLQIYGVNHEDAIQELIIYNLNDMSDSRVVSSIEGSEWNTNCPDVKYPQFVPICYDAIHGVNINQSGTRVYLYSQPDTITDVRWDAVLRIDIDRFDLNGDEQPLADWSFSEPELIYTENEDFGGMNPRPSADRYALPYPEHIGADNVILNADLCAVKYAEYADGASDAGSYLWQTWCIVDGNSGNSVRGSIWQTPDTQLFTSGTNRQDNIYRRHLDGRADELIIENGQHPDAGY